MDSGKSLYSEYVNSNLISGRRLSGEQFMRSRIVLCLDGVMFSQRHIASEQQGYDKAQG